MKTQEVKQAKLFIGNYELVKEEGGYVARKGSLCAVHIPTTEGEDIRSVVKRFEKLLGF